MQYANTYSNKKKPFADKISLYLFFLILFSLLTYKRLNYGSIKVHFFPSLHLQNNNRRGILFEQKNNDPGFH